MSRWRPTWGLTGCSAPGREARQRAGARGRGEEPEGEAGAGEGGEGAARAGGPEAGADRHEPVGDAGGRDGQLAGGAADRKRVQQGAEAEAGTETCGR